MYGALILWAHFLHLLVSCTYCLLQAMFQSGWKQKPPRLTILKLLWILFGLTFFVGSTYHKQSSVIKAPISVTKHSKTYWRNMESNTEHQLHTTLKQIVKQKFQIEKWKPFWRRQWSQIERTRALDLKKHCGHIGLYIKHLLVCPHSDWFLVSHATSQSNWNIKHTGQWKIVTWTWMRLAYTESWNCKN